MKLNLNNKEALKAYFDWIVKNLNDNDNNNCISLFESDFFFRKGYTSQDKENSKQLANFFNKIQEYASKYYIKPFTDEQEGIKIKEFYIVYLNFSFRVCQYILCEEERVCIKSISEEIPQDTIILFGESIIENTVLLTNSQRKKVECFNKIKELAKEQGFSDIEIKKMFNFSLN